MKKLVLMFVAVAAISFASCNGNKGAQEATENDSLNNIEKLDSANQEKIDSPAVEKVDSPAVEAPAQ